MSVTVRVQAAMWMEDATGEAHEVWHTVNAPLPETEAIWAIQREMLPLVADEALREHAARVGWSITSPLRLWWEWTDTSAVMPTTIWRPLSFIASCGYEKPLPS